MAVTSSRCLRESESTGHTGITPYPVPIAREDPPLRPPVRLLHTSDLHLHYEQEAAAVRAIRALRATADEVEAHLVLMAGDIFDTSDQPTEFVQTVAEELGSFGQEVALIPGNHDIRYSPTEADALGMLGELIRPRHLLIDHADGEAALLVDGAVHLWGRGMPEHSPRNDPLAGLVSSDDPAAWSVVMAHGELSEPHSLGRSSPIYLARHADALSRVHYVALGHHDDAHVTALGSTVVCYSGSVAEAHGTGEYAVVDLRDEQATVTIHRMGTR
jgi:DNA repair exonuclease SbcCD nuclease subunit